MSPLASKTLNPKLNPSTGKDGSLVISFEVLEAALKLWLSSAFYFYLNLPNPTFL